MTRPRLALLLLLLALAVGACAGAGRGSAIAEPQEPATLEVENQNWMDMNIYVVRSGQRIRLGTIPGASTRSFTIPAYLIFGATQLQFVADPVGAGRLPVTQEISVSPGDTVVLTIPN